MLSSPQTRPQGRGWGGRLRNSAYWHVARTDAVSVPDVLKCLSARPLHIWPHHGWTRGEFSGKRMWTSTAVQAVVAGDPYHRYRVGGLLRMAQLRASEARGCVACREIARSTSVESLNTKSGVPGAGHL